MTLKACFELDATATGEKASNNHMNYDYKALSTYVFSFRKGANSQFAMHQIFVDFYFK